MYQLKVNQQQSIIALHEQGWSKRRIARELGLDRGTVRNYLAGISKPATPHTGSVDAGQSKPATDPHTGSAGPGGPASLCEPWREQIEQALERCGVREVLDWCRKNLGTSVQSQRRRAYAPLEGATNPG